MGSMPTDRAGGKPPPADGARRGTPDRPQKGRRPGMARAGRRARDFVRRSSAQSAKLVDFLARDNARRQRASLTLALGLNLILFTLLAVFGRFHIWIPMTPGDDFSVVMVELPTQSVLPEPSAPEVDVEPEPVPPEPEPEPEPEPAPPPEPEPEPEPEPVIPEEPQPAEQEPAPVEEPEPTLDLTIEESFAPPADDPALLVEPEPVPPPGEEALIDDRAAPAEEETPAEEAADEEEGAAPGAADDIAVESGRGEDSPVEEIAPETEEALSGDDMFDEEPSFSRRFVLPQVDLPTGDAAAAPGASGVVAIFCPEQFDNDDKIAECAGRTEIRSGWRPGASGEDWSEAARLLRRGREAGTGAPDSALILGPGEARRRQDARAVESLRDPRRSMDGLNDQAGESVSNSQGQLGRPAIGPAPFEPSWTLRDDPNVSRRDLRRLERELEEAEPEE